MGLFDWLPGFKPEVRSNSIAGGDALQLRHSTHDGESVEDPRVDREYGASGTPMDANLIKQVDYNIDWMGEKGIALANQMRKSDGSVRSVTQAIKLPLRRAAWKVEVADPDNADDEDRKIAKFCHDHLVMSDDRHEDWDTVMRHILLMLDFGVSVLEKVWTQDREGKFVPSRLAPRLPQTIKDFEVNKDGTLKNVIQEAPKHGHVRTLKIPAQYAVVMSYEKEGDNYWGVPLLRYLYQHWFYKTELYKIDAVRLDRLGVGIPTAIIAKGYVIKKTEKAEVIALLKGLRSHNRAFAMLPEEIQLKILTPENERGGASGLMESVDHHDVMMARSVLALFLTAGSQKHGNYGTTVTWQDLFLYALQALALQIGHDLQRQVIRDMCNYNFVMKDRQYPTVKASTLEDTNIKEFAASMYNLVLGQVIIPDDTLEAHTRTLMGLPTKDAGYGREELGIKGMIGTSAAELAPNITGKPSPDDKEAAKRKGEPTPGTKPSTTPPSGPIRVPGELT
jgi:hypothetical protein